MDEKQKREKEIRDRFGVTKKIVNGWKAQGGFIVDNPDGSIMVLLKGDGISKLMDSDLTLKLDVAGIQQRLHSKKESLAAELKMTEQAKQGIWKVKAIRKSLRGVIVALVKAIYPANMNSERDHRMLELIIDGCTVAQIAKALKMSAGEVDHLILKYLEYCTKVTGDLKKNKILQKELNAQKLANGELLAYIKKLEAGMVVVSVEDESHKALLDMKVCDCLLSAVTQKNLMGTNLLTIRLLVACTVYELHNIVKIPKAIVRNIEEFLCSQGLAFKSECHKYGSEVTWPCYHCAGAVDAVTGKLPLVKSDLYCTSEGRKMSPEKRKTCRMFVGTSL